MDNRLSIAREQCKNGTAVVVVHRAGFRTYISFVVSVSWVDSGTRKTPLKEVLPKIDS